MTAVCRLCGGELARGDPDVEYCNIGHLLPPVCESDQRAYTELAMVHVGCLPNRGLSAEAAAAYYRLLGASEEAIREAFRRGKAPPISVEVRQRVLGPEPGALPVEDI